MPVVKISGMSCGHCTGSVTKTLEAMEGITNVQVSLSPGQATFDAKDDVDLTKVAEAIRGLGFEIGRAHV